MKYDLNDADVREALEHAFFNSWSQETLRRGDKKEWDPRNPARHQCYISSAVVYGLTGALVYVCPVIDKKTGKPTRLLHCYNSTSENFQEEFFDVTRSQFPFLTYRSDYSKAKLEKNPKQMKRKIGKRFDILFKKVKCNLERILRQG